MLARTISPRIAAGACSSSKARDEAVTEPVTRAQTLRPERISSDGNTAPRNGSSTIRAMRIRFPQRALAGAALPDQPAFRYRQPGTRQTPSFDEPSISQGEAVLARVGTADQHAALAVDDDGLAAAQRGIGIDQPVAALGQPQPHRTPDPRLDLEVARIGHQARPIEGRLRIQGIIEQAGDQVGLPYGLVMAAHHPEAAPQLASPEGEPGNDGVHRPITLRH